MACMRFALRDDVSRLMDPALLAAGLLGDPPDPHHTAR